MAKLQRRVWGDADDVREVPLGRLETYDLGSFHRTTRGRASGVEVSLERQRQDTSG